MKQLLEIKESDVGLQEEVFSGSYRLRKAGRAIVFNKKDEVALLFVSKYNYYKLPGGGIKHGESLNGGLQREVLEETGAEIRVGDGIGEIVEYRDQLELRQTSYCFTAKVVGDLVESRFTDKEKSEGFQLKWVSIDQAIELVKNSKPTNYEGKFIQKRDLKFLLAYGGSG